MYNGSFIIRKDKKKPAAHNPLHSIVQELTSVQDTFLVVDLAEAVFAGTRSPAMTAFAEGLRALDVILTAIRQPAQSYKRPVKLISLSRV